MGNPARQWRCDWENHLQMVDFPSLDGGELDGFEVPNSKKPHLNDGMHVDEKQSILKN